MRRPSYFGLRFIRWASIGAVFGFAYTFAIMTFVRFHGASCIYYPAAPGLLLTHYQGHPYMALESRLLPVCAINGVFYAVVFGVVFCILCRPRSVPCETAEPGNCVKCGYDLRASKDRCPECGTPRRPLLRSME